MLILFAFFVALGAVVPFCLSASLAIHRSRSGGLELLKGSGVPFLGLSEKVLARKTEVLLMFNMLLLGAVMLLGWSGCQSLILGIRWTFGMQTSIWPAALSLVIVTLSGLAVLQLCKAFVLSNPERVLCYFAPLIWTLFLICYPLTRAIEKLGLRLAKAFGVQGSLDKEHAVSPGELSEIIKHSSEAGEIEEDERELIEGVVKFSDTVAEEVMTPRKDILSVSEDTGLAEILEIFREQGLSRLLITGQERDDVKGILLAKDLLRFVKLQDPSDFSLKPLIRAPYFIPGKRKLDDLLHELRRRAEHMAVVLDLHGGVDGLITMEDIIEEIVGDIFDEYDLEELGSPAVVEGPDGVLLIDGSILIEDLNSGYQLDLPEGDYHTLAGFIFSLLGRVPDQGEQIEVASYGITVEKIEQNRIKQLSLRRPENSLKSAESSPNGKESKAWEETAPEKVRASAVK